MKALQHFNVSHNALSEITILEPCFQNNESEADCTQNKKILETIDFSDNPLDENLLNDFTSFFNHVESKKLYLKNNKITSLDKDWIFIDKSLRVLDLKHNAIDYLSVSQIYLNSWLNIRFWKIYLIYLLSFFRTHI